MNKISKIMLFSLIFIACLLFISYSLSYYREMQFQEALEKDIKQSRNNYIERINQLEKEEPPEYEIVSEKEFILRPIGRKFILVSYKEEAEKYLENEFFNRKIPFDSYFKRFLISQIHSDIISTYTPNLEDEIYLKEMHGILSNQLIEWGNSKEEWNQERWIEFKKSPEYKEFLEIIFAKMENINNKKLDILYQETLNMGKKENGTILEKYYIDNYVKPMHKYLLELSYERYLEDKRKEDWISAYAENLFIRRINEIEVLYQKKPINWNFWLEVEILGKEYSYPDPYFDIIGILILSLVFTGIVSLVVIRKYKTKL